MKASSLFYTRKIGYVVGLCMLLVGALGYLMGYVSPYWRLVKPAQGDTQVHGLWLICGQSGGGLSGCQQTINRAPDWLRWVQFLETVGLLLMIVSCMFAIILNWAKSDVHTRLLEIFTAFSALFALTGSLLYVFITLTSDEETISATYNWSFGVNMAGSILLVIAAILIATHNPAPSGKRKKRGRGENFGHTKEALGGKRQKHGKGGNFGLNKLFGGKRRGHRKERSVRTRRTKRWVDSLWFYGRRARITESRMTGARDAGARMTGARVAGARMTGARVAGARVTGVKRLIGWRVRKSRRMTSPLPPPLPLPPLPPPPPSPSRQMIRRSAPVQPLRVVIPKQPQPNPVTQPLILRPLSPSSSNYYDYRMAIPKQPKPHQVAQPLILRPLSPSSSNYYDYRMAIPKQPKSHHVAQQPMILRPVSHNNSPHYGYSSDFYGYSSSSYYGYGSSNYYDYEKTAHADYHSWPWLLPPQMYWMSNADY